MKDSFFYRNSYKVKNDIFLFFKRYRLAIFLLTIIFVFGFITGIFVASNYSENIEVESIPDKNFIAPNNCISHKVDTFKSYCSLREYD